MKIYKCIFDATSFPAANRQVAATKIMKKIAEVFSSFNNVRLVNSQEGTQYGFIYTYNLSGGSAEEFTFASSEYPERYIGTIVNVYSNYTTPNNFRTPSNYAYYRYGRSINEYNYNEWYFIADDNEKLIGMFHVVQGFILFYYGENGLEVMWQKDCDYPDWNPGQGSTHIVTSFYTGGSGNVNIRGVEISQPDTIIHPGENYRTVGYNFETISQNIDNYTYPTGKMIKHPTIKFDSMAYVDGEMPYPTKLFGNGMIVNNPQNCPTLKKIQVDGKNYIHIGGTNWIEYSSITERTYVITE